MFGPALAFGVCLLAERHVSDGMVPKTEDVARLPMILGRPLHTYRDFASKFIAHAQHI